jgi:hypothetical protein
MTECQCVCAKKNQPKPCTPYGAALEAVSNMDKQHEIWTKALAYEIALRDILTSKTHEQAVAIAREVTKQNGEE